MPGSSMYLSSVGVKRPSLASWPLSAEKAISVLGGVLAMGARPRTLVERVSGGRGVVPAGVQNNDVGIAR